MKNVELFVSVLMSLITFGTMIYKILVKKVNKRENVYYRKVIQPYIKKMVKNSDLSSVNVLKNIIRRDDDNIPKYIFYLIDNNMEEQLKKVLIYDYSSIYPNDDNSIERMERFISKLLYYMLFFMTLFCMFYGTMLSIVAMFDMTSEWSNGIYGTLVVDGIEYEGWQNGLKQLGVGIFFIVLSFFFGKINKFINIDMYSLRIKKIKRLINYKVRKFDKKHTQYFI